MKKRPFENMVVTVSGGACGIGRALCEKFGMEGAAIAFLDHNKKETAQTENGLIEMGITARGYHCDITIEDECSSVFKEIISQFGGIDILINNAGITQRSPFVKTGTPVYRHVMDVNFFGAIHCTDFAMDSLIERKGMIIVTSSIAGLVPLLGRSGYSASKHALHGFFGTLRSELRQLGVHVMIVCPGFTKTNLQSSCLDGDGSVTGHRQSRVGKESTPAKVAEAVFRGALKRKGLLVLSGIGKLSYIINRIFPSLYERLMERNLKSEIDR
ncbi:SDR family oxidoreductase [Spirochaetota bacterium]